MATTEGYLDFAPVVFLPHGKNEDDASFFVLKTAKHSLKVTPGHLVLASPASDVSSCDPKDFQFVRAEDVKVGMCLSGEEAAEPVVEIIQTKGKGVYTLVTNEKSGVVVVNGLKVAPCTHACFEHLFYLNFLFFRYCC